MDAISTVFKVSEMFMKDAKFARISDENLEKIAETMKEEGKLDFFAGRNKEDYEGLDFTNEIKLELLASSINYCYWYGRPEIRPAESSSTLMYALLADNYSRNNRQIDMRLIDNFVKDMSEARFPLIEERARHLVQTASRWNIFVKDINDNKSDVVPLMNLMVREFPGFASDMFLKRASLFFLQLNRKFGWFEDSINRLPIPADYQVPKILRNFKVLDYNTIIAKKIQNNTHIPVHSPMECEIRAATILACKRLTEITEWTISEVDTWLWTKRKECKDPFHLTITTDY